jgi:hypothetical protein
LLVLIGSADIVTPVSFCEEMKRAQSESGLELVIFPRGRLDESPPDESLCRR